MCVGMLGFQSYRRTGQRARQPASNICHAKRGASHPYITRHEWFVPSSPCEKTKVYRATGMGHVRSIARRSAPTSNSYHFIDGNDLLGWSQVPTDAQRSYAHMFGMVTSFRQRCSGKGHFGYANAGYSAPQPYPKGNFVCSAANLIHPP